MRPAAVACGRERLFAPLSSQKNDAKEVAVTRWEYVTTPLMIHNTAAILNNWGSDGWELVQIVTGPEGGLVAYLKRPIMGEES